MYCKGFDFSKTLDGDPFPSNYIVKVTGTHSGVLLLQPASIEEYREVLAKERERLAHEAEQERIALEEAARLSNEKEVGEALKAKRTWKDKTGSYSVVAAYWRYEPGFVILLREDRSKAKVPLSQLSEDDRAFAVRMARERGHLGE